MKKKKDNDLVEIYKAWPKDKLDEEIEAFFDIGFALLEASESDSIELYPNPNIKLKFECEIIKDPAGKFYN